MLKVVIDANVWISGLINTQGRAGNLVKLFRADAFAVCCSLDLLQELQDVLARRKIAARIDQTDADELIKLLKARAIFVMSDSVSVVSRDPKDDVYLACAAAGDADVLITGDQDLLVLKAHGRTRILTPAQFLDLLEAP